MIMKNNYLSLMIAAVSCVYGQQPDYFPLAVDHHWEYVTYFLDTVHVAVEDTQSVNGIIYYKVKNFRGDSESLFRSASDKIYMYASSKEFLFYDFSANAHDHWLVPEPGDTTFLGNMTLESKTDTIITPLGIYTNCYRFSHDFAVDYAYREWFASGIGLVRRDYSFIYYSNWLLINHSQTTPVPEESGSVPVRMILYPNHPNPFNPETAIEYELIDIREVKLTIYDSAGREVNELLHKTQAPGKYSVVWHGTNKTGKQVASGIYFCALQGGGLRLVQKMLLYR